MATLPKAIREQIAAADALIAQQTPTNQPGDAPPDLSKLAAQAAEPPAVTPEPQPATPPAAEPPPAPKRDPEELWESRYKTLKGLFDAEVPRQQKRAAEAERALAEATARLDKLTAQVESLTTQPRPTEPSAVEPKDVENFGADLVGMVQRVAGTAIAEAARNIQTTVVSNFEGRLAQLEQTLKGTTEAVVTTAEQAFFVRLAGLVPDYQTVNEDGRFLTWLGEVDPVYGQPRQAALDAAQQSLNAERVAAVFNAFKAAQAPATPAPSDIDKQVSPSTAAPTPVAPAAEKPTLTQAQIVKFYDDLRRGVYRGRDEEAQRIEQVINLAIAEGRVR